ncbi:MAG TPA: fasciclin domain-containing protein [Dyadobacter sp.]|jgi:uncharacterized surface protein with fasciclin (FAS1) repeats|nr:fasciclin domain-containing protein [Dyadobacter sp.]
MKKYHFTGQGKALFLFSVLFSAGLVSCEENSKDLVKPKTVTDILAENDQFSTLNEIVVGANAADAFRTENFTFFAPNNTAFQTANLTSSQVLAWEKDSIMSFLKYHVIAPRQTTIELKPQEYTTLNKHKLTVQKGTDTTIVTINNNARIIQKNINTDGGIIQVINHVLSGIKKVN